MTARDEILQKVRQGLGNVKPSRPIPPPPPVRLVVPDQSRADRILSFQTRVEALNGRVHLVASCAEARIILAKLLNSRSFVASHEPFLEECGIARPLARPTKAECATAEVGISSAAYGLAETGTLVVLSNEQEQRLISLLPPAHIAVIPASRMLVNLDEFFTLSPKPADLTSALIFITGPSRTGDIEQILIRGVHGPGEIDIVIVLDH